ncbi:hypothetical protein GGP41_000411 [Bipolaris sorokiniana]|uniref:Carboxylesterase type B domain-containing protein n=1 Tax=Cochliobolus sativus TaxID=45130 RepID=A0A8H5ZPB7_COCSA|nr:hypothetical protein GGP41_000411 [Bipolaris sorokiniana]
MRQALGLSISNVTYPTPGANASTPQESEGCLFLDVFVHWHILNRAGKGRGAPVLVWIHGVGYVIGHNNNPAGFLAVGNSTHGNGGVFNLGFYKPRLVLEWVQKNIHHFGGDKNRITAYSGKDSAPFQQAVIQSPGWRPVTSIVTQEDIYQKFLSFTNTTSLAKLRVLPSKELIRANAQQIAYDSTYGSFMYGPVVDSLFTPLQPSQPLSQ